MASLKTRMKVTSLLVCIWTVSAQNVGPFPNRQNFFNQPFNNQLNTPYVPILSYSNERSNDGGYKYSTADGKQAEESGFLKDVSIGPDGEPLGIQVVQGSYSYTAPDGTQVEVNYIADENGFQPSTAAFGARNPSRLDPTRPLTDRYNQYNPYNPYNPSFNNPIYSQYNRFNNPYKNNRYYNSYTPRPPYNQFGKSTTSKPRDNN